MANIISNSRIVTVSRVPEPIYKYLGIAYSGFGEGSSLWPSNPVTSSERDAFGSGYRGLGTWKWTESGSYTSSLNNATVNALWTSGKSFTIETMVYHTINDYYGIGFGVAGYSDGGIYHTQYTKKCVLLGNRYGNTASGVAGSLKLVINGSTVWYDSVSRNNYSKYWHIALTYDSSTSTYCVFIDGHKVCEVVDTSSHTSATFGNYLNNDCTQLAVYDYVAYTNDFEVSFTVPHIRNPLYGLKVEGSSNRSLNLDSINSTSESDGEKVEESSDGSSESNENNGLNEGDDNGSNEGSESGEVESPEGEVER